MSVFIRMVVKQTAQRSTTTRQRHRATWPRPRPSVKCLSQIQTLNRQCLFTKRLFQYRTNVDKSKTFCIRREIHKSSTENIDVNSQSAADENNHEAEALTESIRDGYLVETCTISQSNERNCRILINRTFINGELAMIIKEDIKRHKSMKVIVKLMDNAIFSCKYGAIPHRNIIGQSSGREFLTSQDLPVLIRRPSLEDYILRMQRLPVISFPKDVCTMLMMIDTSPGDVILEAGTGSGAVTLFLSKAVGYQGKIHTMEVKKKHHQLAIKNFNRWRDSWNLSHDCKWTSNVQFHEGCLKEDGYEMLKGITIDGAVIDMEDCHTVLPVIAELLKNGGAVCFYVVNITQIIEIYEIIRIKELAFTVENVVEVGHRYWLVNPAKRRSGNIIYSTLNTKNLAHTDEENIENKPGPQVPKYIARPSDEATEHSAFLVKVVKLESYPSSYKV